MRIDRGFMIYLPILNFDEISILIFELDGANIINSENSAPMCLIVIFYAA